MDTLRLRVLLALRFVIWRPATIISSIGWKAPWVSSHQSLLAASHFEPMKPAQMSIMRGHHVEHLAPVDADGCHDGGLIFS